MVDEPQASFRHLGEGMGDALSARALVSSIRRHWGAVLALSLSLCALGAVAGLGLPLKFQAEGVLVINSRPERLADIQELPGSAADLPAVLSEVDVLRSRSVIEPVVRSLGLWREPEFNETHQRGGWSWQILRSRLQMIIKELHRSENIPDSALRGNPSGNSEVPSQAAIDRLVESYMRNLSVSNDGHSMTIRVSYRARTPERAAEVVNAHLQSYENLRRESEAAAAKRANSWLTSRVAELRTELQAVETAIGQYRQQHHLIGAAPESGALSTQLAALNAQLIAAQADLAESEAKAGQVDAGATRNDNAAGVPEVVASPTIRVLREQEAQLVQREAGLVIDHGDGYPELQRVRSSLRNLRAQIDREIRRNHTAALYSVERSRAREQSIQQSIIELTKQVNTADAGLQQLQDKADSIRSILRSFEKRAEETAASPAFITSKSSVVSWANPSAVSRSQTPSLLPVVGGFVGFVFGSLLALLLDHRDKTFRTSIDLQRQIGVGAVGVTPRVSCRKNTAAADIILTDNHSVFAEALRLSWANIELAIETNATPLSGGMRSGVALGITSAATGEGKSTHALALARTAALAGEKAILVDADLRRCGTSRILGQNPRFTLDDFLRGGCTASEVICVEESSLLNLVLSKPRQFLWATQDLARFADLISHLKLQFDRVIVDMPPILGLAETIRLTSLVDGIVLIIRWGRTERQIVQYALDALGAIGISAAGVILNDIDVRAQRRLGYPDRTIVYTDRELYRLARDSPRPAVRPAVPAASSASEVNSNAGEPEHEFQFPRAENDLLRWYGEMLQSRIRQRAVDDHDSK